MEQPSSHDNHDESYFASFTDMLVGIIFIFIILLMIVANNYQAATEAVTQSNKALEEARNKARDEARDKIRDEARDEIHRREIAEIKASADTKLLEAAQALEEVRALEAARKFQEAKALEITSSLQDIQAIEDKKAKQAAKANDAIIMQQLSATQQNIFNDARTRVLMKIKEAYAMQGIAVSVDSHQGTLSIPEKFLFGADWTSGELNYKGEQTIDTLATLFTQYLPCISPTINPALLMDCNDLATSGREFTPSTGLDVIFIDDYPNGNLSRENKLLLSVQRTVSVFNALKKYAPTLDNSLKNSAGAPILDIKINQERRKAQNTQPVNPASQNHVVLRFVMRKSTAQDLMKLKNSMEEMQ